MKHFLEGSAPLRLWHFNLEDNICICYSSLLGYLMYQCLKEAIPSWKCSIKTPNKCKLLCLYLYGDMPFNEVNDWAQSSNYVEN